jgi:hypothetical protein
MCARRIHGFSINTTTARSQFEPVHEGFKFLILNSLSLLNKNISLIQDYRAINLFLDNDNAGRDAKETLVSKGIQFQDASNLYTEYKDVNEYLVKSQRQRLQIKTRKGFGSDFACRGAGLVQKLMFIHLYKQP